MQIFYLSCNAHPQSFGSFIKRLKDAGRANDLESHASKIYHIANIGGIPQPPYAKPLREVDGNLNEIRSTISQKEELRIYYFVDQARARMVLLNITIKPSHYDGTKKKKVEKEIQKDIQEALKIKANYLTSQNDYEKL